MTLARRAIRAAIAGLGLLDIRILGRTEEVADAMLARRHPFPEESVFDQLVARRLVGPSGSSMKTVVAELLESARGSVIRILAEIDQDPHVSLISPTSARSLWRSHPLRNDIPLLADSHLHSGAAVPFESFVDILATASHALVSAEDRERGIQSGRGHLTGWVTDGRGNLYCDEILVGAVRIALRRLLDPKGWGVGIPESMALFEAKEYWNAVAGLAQAPSASSSFQEELLGPLAEDLDPHGLSVERALGGLLASACAGDPDAAHEMVGLAGGMSLVHHIVSSQLGEGLARFVDRFGTMGFVRDLGYGDATRGVAPALAERIFRAAYCSPEVVAVDFRKTYRSSDASVPALEEAITSSVRAHLSGGRDFAAAAGRSIRLAVPIGFSRDRHPPARHPWRWCARFPLAGVSNLADATVNMLRQSHPTLQVVRGLDTAGDESAMPNWPFLAAYESIQARLGDAAPVASIHAGESFSSRLSGVRRIGEVLISGASVSGIGHGLALDSDMSELIVGEDPMPPSRLDAVADLCWLCVLGVEVDEAFNLLERLAVESGLGRGVRAPDLVPGWAALHSVKGLESAGLCDENGRMLNYVDDTSVMYRDSDERASWILAYVSPGQDCFDGYLTPELHSRYQSLATQALDEALDRVITCLRDRAITIEACPTSNQRLSGLPLLRLGPWERLADLGLRVSLNSDDPTIFDTNIVSEWARLGDAFGVRLANRMANVSLESCAAAQAPLDFQRLSELLSGL